MRPLYENVQLKHPAKQIRLLQYQPQNTTSEDNPHFSLLAYDLDQDWPEYIAISYTWGDKEPTLPLTVNGHVMRVRFNCWHALWQLRYHQISGPLWIDSLCIDQENDVEKSAQVGMMGRIFEKAVSVGACIGPGDVLDRMRTFSRSSNSTALFAVLEELDHIAYFNRLWIKQEFILAKDICFYCGSNTLKWGEMEKMLGTIRSTFIRVPSKALPKLVSLWKHRSKRLNSDTAGQQPRDDTLLDLLQRYGDAHCADPRDKVYGLLSLLSDGDTVRVELRVDYTQSSFHLFRQMIALCFHQQQFVFYRDNDIVVQTMRMMGLSLQTPELAQYLTERSTVTSNMLPSTTIPVPARQHVRFYIGEQFVYVADVQDKDFNWNEIPWWRCHRAQKIGGVGMIRGPLPLTQAMRALTKPYYHHPSYTALPKTFDAGTMFKIVKTRQHKYIDFEYYVVHADTLPGDIIAHIAWGNRSDNQLLSFKNNSRAILRRHGKTSKFELRSWATCVDRDSPKLEFPPVGPLRYDDILAFLLSRTDKVVSYTAEAPIPVVGLQIEMDEDSMSVLSVSAKRAQVDSKVLYQERRLQLEKDRAWALKGDRGDPGILISTPATQVLDF